jgi:aryl-alcohol dehydrogenase-like predicted oxidoreductase
MTLPLGRELSREIERWWYLNNPLAMFARSSQWAGFFSGKFDPASRDKDPVVADLARVWYNADIFEKLARAQQLAEKKCTTANQIALAYVLRHPLEPFALIGPEAIEELRTSLAALEVELTPDEMRWLNLEG